ncbi:hypothetical protein [Bacillus cereus]|nr:hypothetical protein [Bacillus cereus]
MKRQIPCESKFYGSLRVMEMITFVYVYTKLIEGSVHFATFR